MKRLYLDTCVYIYHLEAHPQFGVRAGRFFEDAENRKLQIIASPLVLHEVMAGIYKNAPKQAEEVYALIVSHPGIIWVDYSIEVADLSATLRTKQDLKTPDAIHLATAIQEKCSGFVTNDARLKRQEKSVGIKISLI